MQEAARLQRPRRIRVGTYRIVYAIDDGRRNVDVTRIAHRKDVYE